MRVVARLAGSPTCAATGSLLTTGLLRMLRARLAYLSVLSDSSRLTSAGDTHAIITVRELPPRESCAAQQSGMKHG